MRRRRLWTLALFLTAVGGCGACREQGVEVGGPTPYVRCGAVDAAEPRKGRIGAIGYELEERALTLADTGDALRVVAFRGPGRTQVDMQAALAGLAAHGPELVLVLGGLTDGDEGAEARLEALASLGVPTVVLPGGADDAEALAAALDDLPQDADASVFDGRRLRTVRAGGHEIVLVSGAPHGRYAFHDGACGVSAEDLDALSESLGAPDEGIQRWLVSWAAPSGGGPHSVARGFGDVDAGDPAIAALMKAIRAEGGIFAFPETRALLPSGAAGDAPLAAGAAAPDARIVVAPIAGLPVERADGSLVPPAGAILTLGPAGLSLDGPSGGAP